MTEYQKNQKVDALTRKLGEKEGKRQADEEKLKFANQ